MTTFGCQMNEHDSERMKGMLESLGYREVGRALGLSHSRIQQVVNEGAAAASR